MIKIKDFAEKTGFSIRMLRYLEEFSLLMPTRSDSNYRQYNDSQIDVAKKIRTLQSLGFQLGEIKMLSDALWSKQIPVIKTVLLREHDIAEMKSETIPKLQALLDAIQVMEMDIFKALDHPVEKEKKLRPLDGEEKFQRTAYNIPILRTIYENYLEDSAGINCLETDIMKFGVWLDECEGTPKVYSIFNESAFSFGFNLSEFFISGYKSAWNKLLPGGEMTLLEEFSKEDIRQLLSPHEIIIKTKFEYRQTGEIGEIIIPYTPVYTMAKLK